VGLAAARGLALALDIPVFGVSTLLAHAAFAAPQATERGATIMVVVDSKRADLFVQHFGSNLAPLDAPRLVSVDELAGEIGETPVVVTGDAARLVNVLAPHIVLPTGAPDIAVIARLAWSCDRPHTATPLYVRAPDATRPIAGGRLR
jgi:tRNA threonylcarbamoyladenosine biosynthesis protein TsaB